MRIESGTQLSVIAKSVRRDEAISFHYAGFFVLAGSQ
jgi:hypothetical protein